MPREPAPPPSEATAAIAREERDQGRRAESLSPRRDARSGAGAPARDGGTDAGRIREGDGAGPGARPGRPVPVVGVGASAGGLDALERFFSRIGPGGGFAYVVVQRLERRADRVAEVLGKRTALPVRCAAEGVEVEPDCVYVASASTLLALDGGRLRVARSSEAGRTVDAFFRSLAQRAGDEAMAVVLSGEGDDGTAGLRAVKERGGLTLAQAPGTAAHDGMPRSAIEAGLVDVICAPEEMPERLHELARRCAAVPGRAAPGLLEDVEPLRDRICALLHERTNHDFHGYKPGMLLRRVARRAQLRRVPSARAYVEILEQDPLEAELLVRDLLIGVTRFFRDPPAFDAVADVALPGILDRLAPGERARIWVPGCSSGEEAYSLAMLVRERLDATGDRRAVQVFATDVDADAVARARVGRYPDSIAADLAPQRLERFFVREQGGFQVSRELREVCLFTEHDLLRDPPFSSLDLVSCRNLLIYLEPELQLRLVPLFHYALRPGGYLFLGPSEGLSRHPELFEAVDARHRLFARRRAVTPALRFPLACRPSARAAVTGPAPGRSSPTVVSEAFERLLLDRHVPPCAVVNEAGDILSSAGRLSRLLPERAGAPTNNVLELARPPLRLELRAALVQAARLRRRVIRPDVLVELDERTAHVRLTVEPLPGASPEAGLHVVVLEEAAAARDPRDGDDPGALRDAEPVVEQLERELRTTRSDVDALVDELERANEELTSSNEELQSRNEELQTSQEEIQAINDELQRNVEQLATANADLQNLLASTSVATVFLDRALRMTRFTPAAAGVFRVAEGDLGRPLAAFAPRFAGQDLVADAVAVLDGEPAVERHVRTSEAAAWHVVRVLPYRTVSGGVAGVVITSVDVSEVKRAEQELRASEQRFRLALRNAPVSVAAQDRELRYVWAYNQRAAPAGGVLGLRDEEIFEPGDAARLTAAKRRVLEEGVELREQMWLEGPTGPTFLDASFEPIRDDAGRVVGVASASVDLTATKRSEERLRASERRYRVLHESLRDAFVHVAIDGTIVEFNELYREMLGYTSEELLALTYRDVTPERWHGHEDAIVREQVLPRGYSDVYEKEYRRKDGTLIAVELRAVLLRDAAGLPSGMWAIVRDVSDRKRQERRVREVSQLYAVLRKVNEAVVRAREPLELFGDVCRILADDGQRPLVWIGLVEGGTVRPVAVSGAASEYVRDLRVETDGELGQGPGGTCIREGRTVVRDDFDGPWTAPWRAAALAHGLHAVAAFPIRRQGIVIGLLTLYGREPGTFGDEQVRLLEALAADVSFALDKLVQERALHESERSLREADQRKNDFLAVLSHELRNPLAPIRNSLYLLDRAAPGSDQARRAKEVIDRQVVQLSRLVDDLLDVTRITRGKIQVQREPCELSGLLSRTADDHRCEFASAGARLDVVLPGRPLWVTADAARIAQAVGNLLQNAAKFGRPGDTVTLSLEEEGGTGAAIVRVRDTGMGIEPDVIERLFEPFTQADRSLDRSRGGLGLGLALVKGLVELHGGTVEARSDGLGRGAEFTLRLPRGEQAQPGATPAGRPSGPRRPRRVLVIEDNVDSAETLREVLEFSQHTVEVANTGPDGIEKARAFRPDVVLCDIGLPGADGYEVARALRADPALARTRLVALSGYALPEDLQRAAEAGFELHVSKPPDLDRLTAILEGEDVRLGPRETA